MQLLLKFLLYRINQRIEKQRAINISVDKILLKSNFIKIGAILDGLPIIAFGSSETPQIIDTAVVANIPNKIAPGTFLQSIK